MIELSLETLPKTPITNSNFCVKDIIKAYVC